MRIGVRVACQRECQWCWQMGALRDLRAMSIHHRDSNGVSAGRRIRGAAAPTARSAARIEVAKQPI